MALEGFAPFCAAVGSAQPHTEPAKKAARRKQGGFLILVVNGPEIRAVHSSWHQAAFLVLP
jgi:hypothetical protein